MGEQRGDPMGGSADSFFSGVEVKSTRFPGILRERELV
jgi:hypothetical protein